MHNIHAGVFKHFSTSLKKRDPDKSFLETSLGISSCGTTYVVTDTRHALMIFSSATSVSTASSMFKPPVRMVDAAQMKEQYVELAKGKGYIGIDLDQHIVGEFPFVEELSAICMAVPSPSIRIQTDLEYLKMLVSANKKADIVYLKLWWDHEYRGESNSLYLGGLYLGGLYQGVEKVFRVFQDSGKGVSECVEVLPQDTTRAMLIADQIPLKSLEFVLSTLNRFKPVGKSTVTTVTITVRKTPKVIERDQLYLCIGAENIVGVVLSTKPGDIL